MRTWRTLALTLAVSGLLFGVSSARAGEPTAQSSSPGTESVAPESTEATKSSSQETQKPAASSRLDAYKVDAAAPGPLHADRQKVRKWLVEARRRGVGIKAYKQAYDSMETSVKAGDSEEKVKKRLDSICRAIGDQVKGQQKMAHSRRRGLSKTSFGKYRDYGVTNRIRTSDDIARVCERAERDAIDRLPTWQRHDPAVRRMLNKKRWHRKRMLDRTHGYKPQSYYHDEQRRIKQRYQERELRFMPRHTQTTRHGLPIIHRKPVK